VMARAATVGLRDDVEAEYVEVDGENVAATETAPVANGTQSHVATEDEVATDSHPGINNPSTRKATFPARDAEAVMRSVVP